VVDEADYVGWDQIKANVLPHVMLGCVVIMLSTINAKNGILRWFMTVIDPTTGETVFNIVLYTGICEVCMKTPNPENCKHYSNDSTWIKSTMMPAVEALFQRDQDASSIELRNIDAQRDRSVFTREYINIFMAKEYHIASQWAVPWLLITCDPSYGAVSGEGSEFALCASFMHKGEMVVSLFFVCILLGIGNV